MPAGQGNLGDYGLTELDEFGEWLEWERVPSVNPHYARYNGFRKQMEVIFWNSRKYRYSDVETSEWHDMLGAPRPGVYFYHNIRLDKLYSEI